MADKLNVEKLILETIRKPRADIEPRMFSSNVEQRRRLSQSKSITADHIDTLINDPDYMVRIYAATHPNAEPHHQAAALNDPSMHVRANVVRDISSVTPQEIDKTLDNEDSWVRSTAMYNPYASAEHVSKALKDDNGLVVKAAINHPNFNTNHITTVLRGSKYSSYQKVMALKRAGVTSEHIYLALNDPSHFVRKIAITRSKVTSDHIDKAMKDSHDTVRYYAVKHRNASKQQLEQALNDPLTRIKKLASAKLAKINE